MWQSIIDPAELITVWRNPHIWSCTSCHTPLWCHCHDITGLAWTQLLLSVSLQASIKLYTPRRALNKKAALLPQKTWRSPHPSDLHRNVISKLFLVYTLVMISYTEGLNLMNNHALFVWQRQNPKNICFTSAFLLENFGLIFMSGFLWKLLLLASLTRTSFISWTILRRTFRIQLIWSSSWVNIIFIVVGGTRLLPLSVYSSNFLPNIFSHWRWWWILIRDLLIYVTPCPIICYLNDPVPFLGWFGLIDLSSCSWICVCSCNLGHPPGPLSMCLFFICFCSVLWLVHLFCDLRFYCLSMSVGVL